MHTRCTPSTRASPSTRLLTLRRALVASFDITTSRSSYRPVLLSTTGLSREDLKPTKGYTALEYIRRVRLHPVEASLPLQVTASVLALQHQQQTAASRAQQQQGSPVRAQSTAATPSLLYYSNIVEQKVIILWHLGCCQLETTTHYSPQYRTASSKTRHVYCANKSCPDCGSNKYQTEHSFAITEHITGELIYERKQRSQLPRGVQVRKPSPKVAPELPRQTINRNSWVQPASGTRKGLFAPNQHGVLQQPQQAARSQFLQQDLHHRHQAEVQSRSLPPAQAHHRAALSQLASMLGHPGGGHTETSHGPQHGSHTSRR